MLSEWGHGGQAELLTSTPHPRPRALRVLNINRDVWVERGSGRAATPLYMHEVFQPCDAHERHAFYARVECRMRMARPQVSSETCACWGVSVILVLTSVCVSRLMSSSSMIYRISRSSHLFSSLSGRVLFLQFPFALLFSLSLRFLSEGNIAHWHFKSKFRTK